MKRQILADGGSRLRLDSGFGLSGGKVNGGAND